MIVNLSSPSKHKSHYLKPSLTDIHPVNKQANTSRSQKSFIKNHKSKVHQMLQINKKYQQQLNYNKLHKKRQQEKQSPKKISKNQKQKSHFNLSPIKIHQCINFNQKKSIKLQNQTNNHQSPQQKSFTLFGKKFTQKRIVQNESSLYQIPSNQIIISKIIQDQYNQNYHQPLTGFWITQNKLVSLFTVTNRKIDKVPVIHQPYILPILGCLTIKNINQRPQKYIVTELYKSNSLRDVLNEFQNLDQTTVKKYLRKIIICVWNLHKNRITHNRLTLDAFIATDNGELLLNMVKASTKSLSQKQKYEQTHNFSPEMLLSRAHCQSTKNDIWAIGCITLQLLTCTDSRSSPYHPYNQYVQIQTTLSPTKVSGVQIVPKDKNPKFMNSFETSRMSSHYNHMNDSNRILQKVKKLIQVQTPAQTPQQSLICIDLCESIVLKQISSLASDFIKKCLNLRLQKRPSIDELMFHPFLK